MPRIPEDLRQHFNSVIKERTGLYFKDFTLRDLENALLERMKALSLDSPLAYCNTFTASAQKENEFRELLNLLTINHTYFFRNEAQFEALKKIVLPKMDGYKVCRMFKFDEKYKKIPIVMFTARAQDADRKLAEEVGASAYLTKPFDPALLLAKIGELLKP